MTGGGLLLSCLSPAPSFSAGGQASRELPSLLCTDVFMIVHIVSCNLVIISYCQIKVFSFLIWLSATHIIS